MQTAHPARDKCITGGSSRCLWQGFAQDFLSGGVYIVYKNWGGGCSRAKREVQMFQVIIQLLNY